MVGMIGMIRMRHIRFLNCMFMCTMVVPCVRKRFHSTDNERQHQAKHQRY
jgi:hypothetical protein